MLAPGGDRIPSPAEQRVGDITVTIKSPVGKGHWRVYGIHKNEPTWFSSFGSEVQVPLVPLLLDAPALPLFSAKLADTFVKIGYKLSESLNKQTITDIWHIVGDPINQATPDKPGVRVWYGAAAFLG